MGAGGPWVGPRGFSGGRFGNKLIGILPSGEDLGSRPPPGHGVAETPLSNAPRTLGDSAGG